MQFLKPVVLFIFGLFIVEAAGQDCKYPKKMLKYAQKGIEGENIISATKFELIFKDFNKVGSAHFAMTDTDYYLGVHLVRDFSRKMDVTIDNPMIFTLGKDSLVTIYPHVSAKDRGGMSITTPMGTKILKTYYKLDAEQLQMLAAIPIKHVKFYVTLRKKGEDGSNEEDLLAFEVKKEKWQNNFMTIANCILQL